MNADVQKELSRLYDIHNHLTADIVLVAAKNKNSPLHSHFEWKNSTAAHQWRLHQARNLIRCCVKPYATGAAREYVHVRCAKSSSGEYLRLPQVAANFDQYCAATRDLRSKLMGLVDTIRALQSEAKKSPRADSDLARLVTIEQSLSVALRVAKTLTGAGKNEEGRRAP